MDGEGKSGDGWERLDRVRGDGMRYLKEGVVREWGPGAGAGSENRRTGEECPPGLSGWRGGGTLCRRRGVFVRHTAVRNARHEY